ncbi:hypothetical protein HOC32_05025 [Candidatus Woesearchaeota archaeon]|nr:hypothetical protein [Candidatus Woesearchaeota archaeon]
MHNLTAPVELFEKITQSDIYKQWQQHHQGKLSHLFCSITADFQAKGNWEVGFFDQETGKITVFTDVDGHFVEKPADDVFKQPTSKVETLDIETVKFSVKDAVNGCKDKLKEFFSSEQIGDGFAIIQTYQNTPVWNFSFITKTLKFINVKLNATTGELVDHQEISLVKK